MIARMMRNPRPPAVPPVRSRPSVLFVAVLLAAFTPLSLGAEEYTREFLRAVRKLFSDVPRVQAEGEEELRRLGERVLPEIRKWLEDARSRLARMEKIAAELEGEGAGDAEGADERVRAFLAQKLEEGWKHLRDGDHREALRIAQALEALDGGSSRVYDYRRLLRACQKRMIRAEILEPAVEFRERVYEVGETPAILFRLANRQVRQVVIQAERGRLGDLELAVERRFIDGSAKVDVETVPVRTLEDVERVVLAARQAWERDILVELDDSAPASGTVMRVRAVGKFRPSRWGVGKYNVSETLELPVTECWVVPTGEKNLAEDPIRKLEVALIFRDLAKFFVAGQLAVWAAEEDPEMTDRLLRILVDSLDELDAVGFPVADRLLKQAGGVSGKKETDRPFWKEWLAARPQARPERRREPPFRRPPPVILDGDEGPR